MVHIIRSRRGIPTGLEKKKKNTVYTCDETKLLLLLLLRDDVDGHVYGIIRRRDRVGKPKKKKNTVCGGTSDDFDLFRARATPLPPLWVRAHRKSTKKKNYQKPKQNGRPIRVCVYVCVEDNDIEIGFEDVFLIKSIPLKQWVIVWVDLLRLLL